MADLAWCNCTLPWKNRKVAVHETFTEWTTQGRSPTLPPNSLQISQMVVGFGKHYFWQSTALPVSAGFAPWRVCPHPVCSHINSSSNQVLQIYLSHTVKKRQ